MAQITTALDDHGGTKVLVNGSLLACITKETGEGPIAAFIALVHKHADELADIQAQYEAAIAKNGELQASGKPGRFWPIFNSRDRRVRQLLHAAKIFDS